MTVHYSEDALYECLKQHLDYHLRCALHMLTKYLFNPLSSAAVLNLMLKFCR